MATICEEFSTRVNGANFVNLKGQQLHLNAAYQVKKKDVFLGHKRAKIIVRLNSFTCAAKELT